MYKEIDDEFELKITEHKERGPKGGYNFPEKQDYRELVWLQLANHLNRKGIKIGFLPGKLGLEIPVALRFGFKEENLIAIDENAALIASASWRKKYPKIKCYGTDFIRTAERMQKEGIILDGLVLDLCNNFSLEVFEIMAAAKPILAPRAVVALTMLKGRETSTLSVLLARLRPGYYPGKFPDRLLIPLVELGSYNELYQDEYRSGKLSMMYGVVQLCNDHYATYIYLVKKKWLELNIPKKLKLYEHYFRYHWRHAIRKRAYDKVTKLIKEWLDYQRALEFKYRPVSYGDFPGIGYNPNGYKDGTIDMGYWPIDPASIRSYSNTRKSWIYQDKYDHKYGDNSKIVYGEGKYGLYKDDICDEDYETMREKWKSS